MKYSVKFNGLELNEYIDVLDGFTPYIGADWSPGTKSIGGGVNGSELRYQSYGAKTIKMPFYMKSNLREKYDALEKILNVSEPKKLIFGTHPDRYYFAIPSGDLNFDQTRIWGKGTITWLIPDGLAHSTILKEFTASENSDGILEATIVNNGTVEVPISYEITHSADNGYIGIVSEGGAMQYGSIEEADGETKTFSERLMRIDTITSASDDHGTCYLQTDADTSGTLATTTRAGATWLGLGTGGTGSGWNGGMRTITLPADSKGVTGSKNFEVGMNRWFQKNASSEWGLQVINIMGDTHTQIAGIKVFSTVGTYENSVAQFWANGKEYASKTFRAGEKIWSAGSKSGSYNVYRYDNGNDIIRKEGQRITFHFDAKYLTFNIPELADVEATRIQVGFFRYGTKSAISANFYKRIDFVKTNVEKWIDNPNRYSAGDVLRIDGDARKVYVNEIPSQGDEVRGTTYFNAPVGESKVEFMCSSWVTAKPTVKAYIREAYL